MTPPPPLGRHGPEEVTSAACRWGADPTLAKGFGCCSREDCKGGLNSQSIYKLIDHATA